MVALHFGCRLGRLEPAKMWVMQKINHVMIMKETLDFTVSSRSALHIAYIVVLKKHALPNFPTVRPVDMWRVMPTMCYGRNAVRTISSI